MGDMTLRAIDTLRKVDVVACEDTREFGKIAMLHGLSARKLPYHEHNAAEMRPRITRMIQDGQSVALVSDAGMPLVSDPGYKLVEACLEENLYVTCAPGASATLTALVLSGLPSDRFMFAGFLPAKSGARKTALQELAAVPATLIFYETAPRLADSLADMQAVLGDRPAAVARELTKKFEEVRRETLSVLSRYYADAGAPKGEIAVVVGAPIAAQALWDSEQIDALMRDLLEHQGLSVRDAAAQAAEMTGLKKGDLYQKALSIRNENA
jgi:16S rRNA (cytidine1402-2'-O)-methyltransferase